MEPRELSKDRRKSSWIISIKSSSGIAMSLKSVSSRFIGTGKTVTSEHFLPSFWQSMGNYQHPRTAANMTMSFKLLYMGPVMVSPTKQGWFWGLSYVMHKYFSTIIYHCHVCNFAANAKAYEVLSFSHLNEPVWCEYILIISWLKGKMGSESLCLARC